MSMREAKKVDVLLVGLGWTNSVVGMEIADSGLDILALERGPDRDTVPDFKAPQMLDELKYALRHELAQWPSIMTLTHRYKPGQKALPYRTIGSFIPANGVGGAGVHWNGNAWRAQPEEMKLRSYAEGKFGKAVFSEDITTQDYPMTYAELEPYFDYYERIMGIAGKAGNLNGKIVEGGNPFEGPRSKEYPTKAMQTLYNSETFGHAAKELGYHPFTMPSANMTESYTNPYGMQLGPCNYCGFCERFGCYNYSKASPQTCVLGALKQKPNFHYKANSEVLKIVLADDGKTVTGATVFDEQTQETYFQPADLVVLGTFALNNVHMMLYSGIGKPYDPQTGEGVVGKNYAYQIVGGAQLFFKDKNFNRFVGAGSASIAIDDFGTNNMDFGKLGFVGGAYIQSWNTNGQPIRNLPLPPGTPKWGKGWKEATGEWYNHSMSIAYHGSNQSYRDVYCDLDPVYKDRHGRPLMRLTYEFKPNDMKMAMHYQDAIDGIVKVLNPDHVGRGYKNMNTVYDLRAYQSTHNTGGTIIGDKPTNSVVNKYGQVWGVHNLFICGASLFPQNIQYNPTGMAVALALHTAAAIRDQYLKAPRELV